jgi:hypothetical protein
MDTGSTGLGFYTRRHPAPDLLNFQLAIPTARGILARRHVVATCGTVERRFNREATLQTSDNFT